MSITRKIEIVIGVCLSVLLVLLCGLIAVTYEMSDVSRARSIFPYPIAWDKVKVGDPKAAVAGECPNIDQSQHGVSGDVCRAKSRWGWWTLRLAYDDKDRTREKRLSYTLGSGDTVLKEFEFTQ